MNKGGTMKKIPVKNYFILVGMIVIVVIVTFFLAKFYNNMLKPTSDFYKYAKHISSRELFDYLQENSSTIIYISDKYNTVIEDQEKVFKEKIVEHNLYNNLIYIDKNGLTEDFYKQFNKKYNTHINEYNLPVIIILDENKEKNAYYSLSVETVEGINFGDIK